MNTITALAKTLVVGVLFATLTFVPILVCIGATERSEPVEIEFNAPMADENEAVGITLLSATGSPVLAAQPDAKRLPAPHLAGILLATGLFAYALFRRSAGVRPVGLHQRAHEQLKPSLQHGKTLSNAA